MFDMRLIVAGAGGRMGRTLIKAIADGKGFSVAGALEAARSPLIGWDSGTLAGLGENHVKLTADAAPLLEKADGIVDFTAPVATVAFASLAAAAGKVHIVGTTGLSAADEARIKDAYGRKRPVALPSKLFILVHQTCSRGQEPARPPMTRKQYEAEKIRQLDKRGVKSDDERRNTRKAWWCDRCKEKVKQDDVVVAVEVLS